MNFASSQRLLYCQATPSDINTGKTETGAIEMLNEEEKHERVLKHHLGS